MDHSQHMNVNGFPMPTPQMMSHQPPPQIFTSNHNHNALYNGMHPGLDMQDMASQMFGDPNLLDDSNEAKRRRIARVRRNAPVGQVMDDQVLMLSRLAICVGKRRSSATANSLLVRIV